MSFIIGCAKEHISTAPSQNRKATFSGMFRKDKILSYFNVFD